MNIGAVRYINGLTMNKKRVLRAWCCTSSQRQQFGKITVKYVCFSVSTDILSAQIGEKLFPPDTFPCLEIN